MKQLFGEHSTEFSKYLDIELINTMASNPDMYVPCPRPNCPAYVVVRDPGSMEKCVCPTCAMVFCSKCKEPYHYDTTCGEAAQTKDRWFDWMATGKAAYLKNASEKQAVATKKFDEAVRDAMKRFEAMQQDEEWKEKNCRCCPHCGKVVYRVDGCDSMTCGRDAEDKGGGNKQDGCGKGFNWAQAEKYKRPNESANLPKTLADVDPDNIRDLKHHLIAVPSFEKQRSHEYELSTTPNTQHPTPSTQRPTLNTTQHSTPPNTAEHRPPPTTHPPTTHQVPFKVQRVRRRHRRSTVQLYSLHARDLHRVQPERLHGHAEPHTGARVQGPLRGRFSRHDHQ